MKKILQTLFIALLCFQLSAQERYIDRVFTDVAVEKNVTYGVNATLLLVAQVGQAVPQDLKMDVYTPVGDTKTDRPLVLYFHTGNFLPYPQNGSVSGTIRDSTCVDFCTKLAKMGYVVASVDYRLGWDPVNTSKDIRVFTLINAAYRGVQDARTCIRFFKKSFVEDNNKFGVDTGKIVLFGQGTGGYVSANCSSLDNYIKIPTASDGKFLLDPGTGTPIPMIHPSINGDIYGTSVGIVPAQLAPLLRLPAGDTLCYPNHVGYSSEFKFGVNLGGAIADTSWIDPGQKQLLSVHNPQDRFAPYKEGLVLVPVTPPLEVVKVQGSYLIQKLSTDLGNNTYEATSSTFNDPVSKECRKNNDGLDGLFPILTSNPFDSSPWDFWDTTSNVNNANGLRTNPDMTPEKGRRYIDSILTFYAPRACVALNLGCDLSRFTTSTEDPTAAQVALQIAPMPTQGEFRISINTSYKIDRISLVNSNGQIVRVVDGNNTHQMTIQRDNLQDGFYLARIHLKEGRMVCGKVIFN